MIPDYGNFFPDIDGKWFEDLLLWHKMRYEGVEMDVAPGVLTHIYVRRDGSFSGADIEEKVVRIVGKAEEAEEDYDDGWEEEV